MIVWPTIERALKALVIDGTGLNASRVVLSRQKAPRGAGPYADIRVATVRPIGRDWSTEEDNPDSTGSDGRELRVALRGPREMTVVFRCFGDQNSIFPEVFLLDLIARSRLPARLEALNAAGIGLAAWGNISSIDGVIGESVLEPRSTVEMRCFLASEVDDFTTYIESVELENQIDGTTRIVTEGDYDG